MGRRPGHYPPDPLASALMRPEHRPLQHRDRSLKIGRWRFHPPDPLAAAVAERARRHAARFGTEPPPPETLDEDEEDDRRGGGQGAVDRTVTRTAGSRLGSWFRRWRALIFPLITMLGVVGVELSTRQWTYIGYGVLIPMVAANLAGPRITSAWAVVALGTGVFSVCWDQLYHHGAAAMVARFAGLVLGGVMAILASRYNSGRETKLAHVSQVADAAQRAILPDLHGVTTTAPGGPRVAVRYESAASEAMVGGDLYEMVNTPWGTRLLVGDARGKGLDAVRLASRVLGTFRVVARERALLGDVIAALDGEVSRSGADDDFVTSVVVQVSSDVDGRPVLTLANAGHPDVVLVRGEQAYLLAPDDRQPPLGLGAGKEPDGMAVWAYAEPGDRLLLYTDGVAEAREPDSGEFFPLVPAVRNALVTSASLDGALSTLVADVRDWTGGALRDDVALLAVEIPGTWPTDCPT